MAGRIAPKSYREFTVVFATLADTALFAPHHLGIIRRILEKAAVEHPVDFLLELLGAVGLDADQFRHQAVRALLRRQIAQHLLPRAVFVLAQPSDGAVERAAQLRRRVLVDVVAGDDAT